ncbi:MAG TPA: AMP-binding protein [Acidimicrobiales bacterium]
MSLRPTFVHPEADRWAAPGGAWDLPPLDDVLGPSEGVAATAGGLHALGVSRGDVVAWQRPNGPDVVALYRACWRLGAVAAPIHHQAGDAEAARLLARVDPTVFFAADDPLPEGPPAAPIGRSADVAGVLWTAGSAGEPKGVLHTQRTLGYKANVMVDVHGLTAADVVLMPAPLAHISGLLNGLLVPQAAGMRAVFMAKWDPEHAVDLIEAEHITFMVGPPTFFIGLMAADGFSSERVASLRLISSGGAGVTPAFVDEATERLGAVVKRAYGSTEAPTVATAHADDPTERGRDTDGRATGEVQFRLGEGDELLVSGPELCAGYDDPEATKAAFIDGWFHTGDRATIDAEGWITITGRLKDIIIRGGENVSVAAVEATLEAHPSVRHAVVVGAPDDRLGERVVAVVAADEAFDLADCQRWFAEQGATKFTWPERVIVVDRIPTLPAGKPDRDAIRRLVTGQ